MKIKELYSSPDKWTKDWFARDKNGDKVPLSDREATCFCLAGAIERCYPATALEVSYRIETYLKNKGELNHNVRTYVQWNDVPSRTFEDVKTLVEALDV